MPPFLNATGVSHAPPISPFAGVQVAQTPLSGGLLRAGNISQAMYGLNANMPAATASFNPDIPPPVLACKAFITSQGEFRDQRDLDYQWTSLLEQLMTVTLTEQEVLAVLASGVLQTATGKVIAELFASALWRSVKPSGTLTQERLDEIVKAICHLPPAQWQAALGEDLRFTKGQNTEGLTGFIQSHLDRSSALRDERIANDELITDAQWETLNKLTKTGRQYIRSGDGEVDHSLLMLEDARDLRPSPKDVHTQLENFIRRLEEKDVKRVRWTEHYVTEVKALRDQVKPGEVEKPGWLEWIIGPSWLESLFDRPDSSSASNHSSQAQAKKTAPNDRSEWLLSAMQKFERNADFLSNINTKGQHKPETLMGKLLLVCNALDTFGLLRWDSNRFSTAGPLSSPIDAATEDDITGLPTQPIRPSTNTSGVAASVIPSLATLDQFAAQADEVLSRFMNNIMPWNSASATEHMLAEVVAICRDVSCVETIEVRSSYMAILGKSLNTMIASLLDSRVAVLLERNPVKAVGVFAAYLALSNLYASWFQPEPEPMVDSLQGVEFNPDTESLVIFDVIDAELDGLLGAESDLATRLALLVDNSEFSGLAADNELVAGVEKLLQQPVPGNHNVTYQDYVDEIIELALLDYDEEDGTVDGSTTEPASTPPAIPLISSELEKIRSRRSLVDDSGVAHSRAQLLIQAALRRVDRNTHLQPGEEIAPGVTVEQGADLFIKSFVDIQTASDPLLFMQKIINETIANSDLPPFIKTKLDMNTMFDVEFTNPRGVQEDHLPLREVRYESLSLLELFSGQHDRDKKWGESISIQWPVGYTDGFITAVADNNFQERFSESLATLLARSDISELWKNIKKNELHTTIESYLAGGDISAQGRYIANEFLKGRVNVRPVDIRNGAMGDRIQVSNVVYLSKEGKQGGVFVFLGGKGAVIECPLDLFKNPGKSIEEFPELREELSKRINIKELLARDDDDFKYSQGKFEFGDGFFVLHGMTLKFPYWPILFGLVDGVDYEAIGEPYDVFGELYKRQVGKVQSDIDTMTSTRNERMTDVLLELLVESLSMLSAMMLRPEGGAVMKGLAILFGFSSSAVNYGRGLVNDDPQQADHHKANGIRGMAFEVGAPYVGKMLGMVFSTAMKSRIAGTIIERLKWSGYLPSGVIKYLPRYAGVPRAIIKQVRSPSKYIPPIVKGLEVIQSKFDDAFRSKLVMDRLATLSNGPKVAQKLMRSTGVKYFGGERKGYLYRGVVMRGDMRPPEDVFRSGFKLPAPITDLKQANGMSGSIPGESMGISTSPFYKNNGMGAYYQGGEKGGYTYVIDARGFDGYDVSRNNQWVNQPGSKVGTTPYLINYGRNIPSGKILGAYDPGGKFIPNPNAIESSLAVSVPRGSFKVPVPVKSFLTPPNVPSATNSSFFEPL
ncbi:hypothetical protein CES87_29970 [Pseudomonas sp. ERMR1:02]|nr:hypothetical protein CES87_29970 [Pseudomonas sp. ERMR1:02]